MAQKSLLQMLEDLASRVRSLERERREAVTKTQTLEREVVELARLITLAAEKVEEMLKVGANDEIPQPPAVNVPEESKGQKQLGEFSADPQRELKWRSSRTFRLD